MALPVSGDKYFDPAATPIERANDPQLARIADLSNTELDVLAKVRPELKKQLELYKSLRSKRIHLEAQNKGGYAAADPERFIWEVLGWRPSEAARVHGIRRPTTPDQNRVLRSLVDNKRTAVPSGQGVGKTRIAAAAVLWFLYSHPKGAKVITTASSWPLVEAQLWAEIRAVFRGAKLPLEGLLLQTELRISDNRFAIGLSTDDASRFQGFHAPYVLVIIDEATGVREEIWEAASAITVGRNDRILALGNPTKSTSRFAQVCKSPQWNVIRMDCRNHPNVTFDDANIIPGAVSKEWIDDQRIAYGGEDSPLFRARVAGFWPKESTDTLLGIGEVEEAQERWPHKHVFGASDMAEVTHKGKGVALGLDIAGPGSDLCCLTAIEDGKANILWWTVHNDLMDTTGRVVRSIKEFEGRARVLCLDDTGIGNGVSSRLLELQRWEKEKLNSKDGGEGYLNACAIVRINFGSSPWDEDKFRKIKDELWWELAEAVKKQILDLPNEANLATHLFPKHVSMITQLTAPIYELDSAGRIRVHDRRDPNSDVERLRTLPTRSPDIGHSLMLARRAWRMLVADWSIPAAKTHEEQRARDWKKMIRDLIKGKPRDAEGPDLYDYC